MKNLIIAVLFLFCSITYSQTKKYTSNHISCAPTAEGFDAFQSSINFRADEFNQDKFKLYGDNVISKKTQSVLLYKKWNNKVEIHTDSKKFSLDNVNYNIQRREFITKNDDGTYLNFSFNGKIKKVVINGKSFKSFYDTFTDYDKRIYEIVYECDDFSILKRYRIVIIEASPNPMVNRKSDIVSIEDEYYLKEGNSFKSLNLNKKSLFKLCDESKVTNIKQFAKKNSLSFKKEDDVIKILDFSNSLTI